MDHTDGQDSPAGSGSGSILRKVVSWPEPGMNIQDGMLTTHSERTYYAPEADLLREFLGAPDDRLTLRRLPKLNCLGLSGAVFPK